MLLFIILLVLGIQTTKLKNNISDSFTEFGSDVNEISKKIMSDNNDTFIENYVEIEANTFSYIINEIEYDLKQLSDLLTLEYEKYDENKSEYIAQNSKNISNDKNEDKRIKIFYQTGIDRNDINVKKDLTVLSSLKNDLILTMTDALQARNCFIMTENGLAIFATDYDYNNNIKYAGEELDFKSEDWYKRIIATDSIIFGSSYKEALSEKNVIAAEKSFKINGKTEGIIVIEIYTDSFGAKSKGLKSPEGINLFIADTNGVMIYNAKSQLYSEKIAKKGTIYQFINDTNNLESGSGSYIYNGNEYRCFYKKLKDTDFTLYVSIRENRLEESIKKLQELIKDKNYLIVDIVNVTFWNMYIYLLFFVIIILVVLFFIVRRISKSLETPIKELSSVLSQAKKIQQDMLPDEFAKISNRRDIDIYAHNIPETEVGGDFYNYVIRNNKLYLIIADVSGSGMPAALFMAKTSALLNNAIKFSDSPRVILSYVNSELCKNNIECYFVTIALYCIDLKTRKVIYANSGHEDSIIIKNNKEPIVKKEIRTAPMGIDEYIGFKEDEFTLDAGDVLFLYTDGVVESTNKDKKLFGIERLLLELKNIEPLKPKTIVEGIEAKLKDFSEGEEQSDDITMICFKFNNIEIDESKILKYEKSFGAIYENVDEVNQFIEECLKNAYDDNLIYEQSFKNLNVCVEEIVVNISDYAFDTENDEKNIFNVKVIIDKNVDKISISFMDQGKPFNPTKTEDVNILQGITNRNIGGFGIYLTKNLVDILEYSREDNYNVLIITKYL